MPKNYQKITKSEEQKRIITAAATNPYGGKTREQYWTARFPHKPVLYNAQDNHPRDVRNFTFARSYLLDEVISQYKLKGKDDNETMLNCCLFVQKSIKYEGDEKARHQQEFWQYPEDTMTRQTGDCEDGAILMKSLALCCGIPDWKVKIVAGEVTGGGHAYCTYIRDNDTQCVMDWCYWPNQLPVNQRKPYGEEENYKTIWFSFNHFYSFAERRILYGAGKIHKK
jgi:predicted transglutaminase-like cysteine proteinase